MKELCAAFVMIVLAACAQKDEPVRNISEIKGKPIVETPVSNVVSIAKIEVATNAAPAEVGGYARVGFDKLASFHYIMPDEITPTNQPPKDQFPVAIRLLDQKPIALRGFMLPLKIDQ